MTSLRKCGARRVLFGFSISLMALTLMAMSVRADWPQFRGPNRNGKADASGLMKQWPDDGPEMEWAVENLGFGFASPCVSNGHIYTTGMEGARGYVYALTVEGKPKWKTHYGKAWTGGHRGTRSTPTHDEGLLYIMSGWGKLVCLDADSGDIRWSVDTMEKFGAQRITWGITESPLVVDEKVIATPGGRGAGMVAFNKKSGEVIWVCRELSDKSGYCSPILIERGGKRIIVTLTGKSFVGVTLDNGKLLWRAPRNVPHDIHATSPVYQDGIFYITVGYGRQGEAYRLSADGTRVRSIWRDDELDVHHGGTIVLDGRVYGASDRNNRGAWVCLDLETGRVIAKTSGVGKGSIAFADGMIYGYGERGMVGLINPDPNNFKTVSSFRVRRGSGPHWAHPFIADGKMLIRHGDALMVFDIKEH